MASLKGPQGDRGQVNPLCLAWTSWVDAKPSDSKMTLTRLGRTSGLLASSLPPPSCPLVLHFSPSHPHGISAPLGHCLALEVAPRPLPPPSLPRLFLSRYVATGCDHQDRMQYWHTPCLCCSTLFPIPVEQYTAFSLGNYTFLPHGPGLASRSIQPLGYRSHLAGFILAKLVSRWRQEQKMDEEQYLRPWIQLFLKPSRLVFLLEEHF